MPDITQTCRITGKNFIVSEEDQAMLDKLSPVIGGRKFHLSIPTLCPEERRRRRLMFRNDRNLYHRKCDLCARQIISMYPSDSPFTIYCWNCWWGDGWNALDYGRDFDFNRPFSEQFKELLLSVPRMNLINDSNNENSEYVNCTGHLKNCYLCFDSEYGEAVMYSRYSIRSSHTLDSDRVYDCEFCYESNNSKNCYRLLYSDNCVQCSESYFLEDCRSCSDCFGCIGLRNKQYCFFNEQLSKEDYEERIKALRLDTYSGLNQARKLVEDFRSRFPKRASRQNHCEDASGDYLNQSKQAHDCFNSAGLIDCAYCHTIENAKNCMDFESWGNPSELVYEAVVTGENATKVLFTMNSWAQISEILYSDFCLHSSNLFGSSGLKRNQYCILNKQYSKEEYEALVPRIIEHMQQTGEWGEFFPPSLSPFAYNESVANEFFPLSKEEAERRFYRWRDDHSTENYQGPVVELPDSIDDVPDDITQAVLRCETSGKLYKIIPQELAFYRKLRIPLPRLSPNERYFKRLRNMNPEQLWKRNCAKCGAEIETSYSPDRPETVYCETCYLETVY